MTDLEFCEGSRTTFAAAAGGFDPNFRDALAAEITRTIARASITTDAPIMALRPRETIEALVAVLVSMCALSSQFDAPSELRQFAIDLAKRVRRDVGKLRAEQVGAEIFGSQAVAGQRLIALKKGGRCRR
jgi:hypothetical protein